jgi:hypothetical protein
MQHFFCLQKNYYLQYGFARTRVELFINWKNFMVWQRRKFACIMH